MNLLSQIMSEEANDGALLVRVARLSNQLLKYLRRYSNNHKDSADSPVAYKVCCDYKWTGKN